VNTPLFRLFFAISAALIVFGVYIFAPDSNNWVWAGTALSLVAILFIYRLSYMNSVVAYVLPWLMIVCFSAIPISEYSRPLGAYIYALIFTCILTWFVSSISAPVSNGPVGKVDLDKALRVSSGAFWGLFAVLWAMLAFEAAWAGFVPLVSLLTSGDSNYMEFGIRGLHGAVIAYANALACFCFYQYLITRNARYLRPYFAILGIFILLMTRQNILSTLVESTVIWCMVRRPVRRTVLAIGICLFLTAFSVFGELRSGDITAIINVAPEYSHLPKAFYWLYGYSYFNAANLQYMIQDSGAPFFDGSMFSQLLPSFLRGESNQSTYVVFGAMTVTSYLDPIYRDVGFVGAVLVTAFWGRVTSRAFIQTLSQGSFVSVATYACLYYCALFSFFVNNWFYLPVISQIVFFWLFDRWMFARNRLGFLPAQQLS